MSLLNALTVSIAVLAGILTWLVLGPVGGGHLQLWAMFIAWGCFYHCGGKDAGLKNTIVGMTFGAIVGWASLLIATKVNIDLGPAVWPAIVVGIGVGVLVIAANSPSLAVIPANVYGFAAVAAYTLLSGKSVAEPSLANPLINIFISLVIGAIVGYISERVGGMLASKPATA